MDEFARIRRWVGERSVDERVVVDVGDDAAVVLAHPGRDIVLTCDAMVEGVHFDATTIDDASIGWKALAASVSDIAAMGAKPLWALVALCIPPQWTMPRLDALYAGLHDAASAYRVRIVGGDTTAALDRLCVHVTIVGDVAHGCAVRRSGARAGDVVFVTGTLGRAAAGLALLQSGTVHIDANPLYAALVRAHTRPQPRTAFGEAVGAQQLVHALNDVSDGIASEAWEIAEASNVHIVLDAHDVPICAYVHAAAATLQCDARDWALYGGEDYELIGTAPHTSWARVMEAAQFCAVPIQRIGVVREGTCGVSITADGVSQHVRKGGYMHFR